MADGGTSMARIRRELLEVLQDEESGLDVPVVYEIHYRSFICIKLHLEIILN